MKLTRTKIDRNLSQAERGMLIDWLLERSASPTGRQVELGLRELDLWDSAEEPSHQSINEWIRKSLNLEINRREMRSTAEAARMLAGAATGSLAEANKAMLDAMLFNLLLKQQSGEEVSQEEIIELTLATRRATESVQSARKADVAVKLADAKLEEIKADQEAKKRMQEAANTAKESGGLTAKTIESIEEALRRL